MGSDFVFRIYVIYRNIKIIIWTIARNPIYATATTVLFLVCFRALLLRCWGEQGVRSGGDGGTLPGLSVRRGYDCWHQRRGHARPGKGSLHHSGPIRRSVPYTADPYVYFMPPQHNTSFIQLHPMEVLCKAVLISINVNTR